MLFNTFHFFVFFASLFVLFWKMPQRFRWMWLLVASYYFYASWKPAYLGIILITTLINFYGTRYLHRFPRYKKGWLILIIAFNLGTLLVFKYFNFFTITLHQLTSWQLPQFKWLVPIGISFYTLQITGYVLDVYREKIKPEKQLGIFALFVCFFPQLSAGPIERSTTLLPQLRKTYAFDYAQVVHGIQLFTFGLFKKLVIADNLGLVVDRVFDTLPEYKGMSLMLVILFYTWQIYMDFSGYTDMARGVARMVGINLIENFHLPYFATSVRDFWKRWHISFSSWLKEYVYIPLGGNRQHITKTIVNTMIVFTLSGLWHGAAWNFVVWGILHGAWISGERLVKKMVGTRFRIPSILQIVGTYIVLSCFWVFFRAETMADAIYILRYALVGGKNFISPGYLWATLNHLFEYNNLEMMIVFGCLGMAVMLEIVRSKTSLSKLISRQPAVVRFALYSLVVLLIIQFRNSTIKEFIYTRF